MTPNAAHAGGPVSPALVIPGPGTVLFPPERMRPGIPPQDRPRFAAMRWPLGMLDHSESGEALSFGWDAVPSALRPGLMRAGWALLNLPTPEVLLHRSGSTSRPRLSPSSSFHTLQAWKRFAQWLEPHCASLDQVTGPALEEYAQVLRLRYTGRTSAERDLFALLRLWAYAPFLPPGDRIPQPPWLAVGIRDFYGPGGDSAGENTTLPVHPAVMSPLLVWAIRTVTDLAPDILAAHHEMRRLLANRAEGSVKGGRARIREYLRQLRDSGEPLPTYTVSSRMTAVAAAIRKPGRWPVQYGQPPLLHTGFVAGALGVSPGQVHGVAKHCPQEFQGVVVGNGAPLQVSITAQLDGRPWRGPVDFEEAMELAGHLRTAALITVAYLTGMRPKEVLHLERGCGTAEPQPEGTIRYRITGRHFKGVKDSDGNTIPEGEIRPHPWTAIEPVHQAVQVLEALQGGQLLFPRQLSRPLTARTHGGGAMTPSMASEHIQRFTAWANNLAQDHGRPHETIPGDPDGAVTLTRFRRTLAWFVHRRPGGRVALGIQYGHLTAALAESYGGRSRVDMLQILDLERALATADALAQAADRLRAGEGVSGPAAGRYIAAATEFQATYAGGFLTARQHKALLANYRLQVFDHDQALLACNYDPAKALCAIDRNGTGKQAQTTPSHNRCQKGCANISRTDSHIHRIREEITHIDEELAADLTPLPIRQRLQQRRAELEQIAADHHATAARPLPAPESLS
ncbi:hypothetical protein [Streptomyces sp. NPDC060035]|uniref:hypothetical protein n=1 Tax=Streptomyces sp. NPDC060035 TaxID=3347044 RepID=UPI0036C7D1AB